MNDEQLDTVGTFNGGPKSAEALIRRVLIGHIENHLTSLRSALAADTGSLRD